MKTFNYRDRTYSLTDIKHLNKMIKTNEARLKIVTHTGEILLIEATLDKEKAEKSKEDLPATGGSMVIHTRDKNPEEYIERLYNLFQQSLEELRKHSFFFDNLLYTY